MRESTLHPYSTRIPVRLGRQMAPCSRPHRKTSACTPVCHLRQTPSPPHIPGPRLTLRPPHRPRPISHRSDHLPYPIFRPPPFFSLDLFIFDLLDDLMQIHSCGFINGPIGSERMGYEMGILPQAGKWASYPQSITIFFIRLKCEQRCCKFGCGILNVINSNKRARTN